MSETKAPKAKSKASLGRQLLGVALLGVLVYGGLVLLRGVDRIGEQLASFHWWTMGAACGLSLVNYGLRFVKWEYYLRVLKIHDGAFRAFSRTESLLVFLSGFVLTVTPGKVGEVFKSLVLRDLRGIEIARTAPIVVAERLTDLVGVITLIAIGGMVFPGGGLWALAGTGVVLSLLAFVAIPTVNRPLLGWLPRLPGGLGRAGARVAPKVALALLELRQLTSPRHLLLPSLLSVAGWSLEGVGIFLILRGFSSNLGIGHATFSYATATLAGALIPVPGGLGVTEKVLEESMVLLGGVPGPIATSAMLLGRLSTLWFAVAVGFLALALLRFKHPTLLQANVPSANIS